MKFKAEDPDVVVGFNEPPSERWPHFDVEGSGVPLDKQICECALVRK
jgi:hypothetical protein